MYIWFMAKKLALLALVLVSVLKGVCQTDSSRFFITPHHSPTLKFTENLGQWPSQILFKARLDGGAVYLEKEGLTFDFYDKRKYRALHHSGFIKSPYNDWEIKCHAYKIHFEGCNPSATIQKQQEGSDYENFYLGNDQSKWKSNVRNYHQVWLNDIYTDINYEVITSNSGLKYNFHVKPHADPGQIQMRYEGVNDIRLKDGALILKLQVNEVVEQKPYAFQLINGKVIRVTCNYVFKNKLLSFSFPRGYNKNYELVIDPLLVFAAQSGSAADNFGMTATFDPAGNLYSAGTVYDNGYPTTPGAYSQGFSGSPSSGTYSVNDVVITKYNANGTNLLYSTYLGGSNSEVITSLIVDHSDNLCFYGATGSSNFPVTNGAYDVSFNGGQTIIFRSNGTQFTGGTDIYVGKFNSSGTALLAATFLGGSNNDGVNHVNHLTTIPWGAGTVTEFVQDSLQFNYGDQYRGEIQVDVVNNIYIASSTRSSDFPMVNAYDNSLGGKQDAVIVKFNSSLSQLLYSTFIGGSLNDCGNSLIVNTNFEVYATGGTCSSDFPVTPGANSTTYNGGKADGFVVHLNASGNNLLQSTFVGTSSYDQSYFIQDDKYQDIYVYGQSQGNMQVVPTVVNSTLTIPPYQNSNRHQFVRRFNKNLNNITMSTVFGSSTSDIDISPSAFAVDKCNNIYLSGWGGNFLNGTPMSAMPTTVATQSTTDGFDFYFMGLDSNAAHFIYGSYFGGNQSNEHVDGGTSRFDARGRIYQSMCAGCWNNDDFPVTPGAWPNTPGNPNHSDRCNNGVVKLDFQLQMSIATINTQTFSGCAPFTVNFVSASSPTNPGATFKWYLDLQNNITNTTNPNPSITYTAPGIYTVALVINDNLTCNKRDSTISYITVHPKPGADFSVQYDPCKTMIALSHTTSGSLLPQPYTWDFGDNSGTSNLSTPSHTYTNNGTYTVTFTVSDTRGCSIVKTQSISILDFKPDISGSYTMCNGATTTLNATGGTNYLWHPSITLDNPAAPTPVANPSTTVIYTVDITYTASAIPCARSMTVQVLVNPSPVTAFVYKFNACGGGVNFTDQSSSEIASWFWTLGPTKTSTVQNPYNFYNNGGTYTVSLQSTNVYGCKSKFDDVIKVEPPPPLSVTESTLICKGQQARIEASGGTAYQWTPTETLDNPNSASTLAHPVTSTDYSVIVTTTKSVAGKQCEFLLISEVGVSILSSQAVKAMADPPVVVVGEASKLTYSGDPGATVAWNPPTIPPLGYRVEGFPQKPTTYTVTASRGACTETLTVHVDAYTSGCLDNDVFIPNTFTPNQDGQNDVLYVRGVKVDEVYFAVYNRWGEVVFETRDKTKGWDGYYKGKQTDVGVFGWYLRVKCFNGEEAFRKGNVTLLR